MATKFKRIKLKTADSSNGNGRSNGKKSNLMFGGPKKGSGREHGLINGDAKRRRIKSFLVKAKLAIYMEQGIEIEDAAKLCGLSPMQLGTLRSDPEFEEFVDFHSVKCEQIHLNNIKEAGELGQWQASAWMLERKFPDKYGKKDTVRHEYEVKLHSFKKLMLDVINTLEPNIRQMIMQRLRTINIEQEAHQIAVNNSPVNSNDNVINMMAGLGK